MSSNVYESETQGVNKNETCFKILLATDIHLGYGEKNETLGKMSTKILLICFIIFRKLQTADDSFNTFDEILAIANSRDVDFILLGGDLFHDATPSPNSLNK